MKITNFLYGTLAATLAFVGSPTFAGSLQDAIEAGKKVISTIQEGKGS